MSTKNWSQGKFIPQHPEKYLGDVNNITYRSSWELHFNQYVDTNDSVISWANEEIVIEYYHPFYQQVRKYYPDYYVEYIDKDGIHHREIIEVKPENQIFLSKKASKNQKITFEINMAKWTACKRFCDQHGIEFRLVTEKQLFR